MSNSTKGTINTYLPPSSYPCGPLATATGLTGLLYHPVTYNLMKYLLPIIGLFLVGCSTAAQGPTKEDMIKKMCKYDLITKADDQCEKERAVTSAPYECPLQGCMYFIETDAYPSIHPDQYYDSFISCVKINEQDAKDDEQPDPLDAAYFYCIHQCGNDHNCDR